MVRKTCSLKVYIALVIGGSYSLYEGVIAFKYYFWFNLRLYYKWALSVWYSIQGRRKTKNSGGVKTLIFINDNVFLKKALNFYTILFT